MRFLILGGSDAGISAALRAREVDPMSKFLCGQASESVDICATTVSSPWDVVQLEAHKWTAGQS